MLKKFLIIFVATILAVIIYLLAVNWSIYFRMGLSGLMASDNHHEYLFNQEQGSAYPIIYAALGDSLTAGVGVENYEDSYPYLVAKKIAGNSFRVIHHNFSYQGARTINIINDLLIKTIADQPDIITILIGTNDVHGHVSAADFEKNYQTILAQLKSQTSAKINLISIPYLGSESLLLPPFNYYFHSRVDSFNKIIKNLAEENGLNYIDIASPSDQAEFRIKAYYSRDEFHPAAAGYKYWSQIIYDNLNK